MLVYYLKAIHIIGLVSWFAGLFYLIRLFVYHAEANEMEEPKRGILRAQYALMEKRLFYIITWPGMVVTVVMGTWMILTNPALYAQPWMYVKLSLVLVLIAYHLYCTKIMRGLEAGTRSWTSFRLRLWNEVATILLVAIVFLAVLKHSTNFLYGVLGLISLGMSLMLATKAYKKFRKKNPDS